MAVTAPETTAPEHSSAVDDQAALDEEVGGHEACRQIRMA